MTYSTLRKVGISLKKLLLKSIIKLAGIAFLDNKTAWWRYIVITTKETQQQQKQQQYVKVDQNSE